MATHTFTYTGTVTPKATKYLTSQPLKMDFTGTIDVAESDAAHAETIDKEFQKLMKKQIEAQLAHLNTWLTERDGVIDGLIAKYEKLKGTFPDTQQSAQTRVAAIKEMAVIGVKIQNYPEDYKEIVSAWAENCRQQQGLIAMRLAVKAARVTTFNDKAFRVRAGQVVKGILIVAAVALSIAAIVVSAGTTAPLFVGLAATGIAISGITGIGQIAKMVNESFNMEKRILANVQKDVNAVVAAFDGVKAKGSNLSKHVTELANLMKIREDNIGELQNESAKYTGMVNAYVVDLEKVSKDPLIDPKVVSARQKSVEELRGKLVSSKGKIDALKASNVEAQKLLNSLKDLGVKLDDLTGATPSTVTNSLKTHLSNVDNLLNYSGAVGSTFSGVSGIHS